MEKLLYRPKEAAQMLGIGRATLYDLMHAGRIRSVKTAACGSSPSTRSATTSANLRTRPTRSPDGSPARPQAQRRRLHYPAR
jgi:excisionase family DNA binding protein